MQRGIVFLDCLCLFLAVSCGKLSTRGVVNIEEALKIEVLNGKNTHVVSGWCYDDTLFVAVPSYVCDDSLKIYLACGERFDVTDTLTDEIVSFVHPEYGYKVKGKRDYVLVILKSANIPTVYIDTESGSDEYINEDKSHKERCNLLVINSDGEVSYSFYGFGCSIKGRGNSTWRMEKKPYLLKLPKKSSFLGMKPAKKWVFLANAADQTNLRNKIVYDFARRIDFGFVPDSRYADVFLNGKYNGLYLITEKVEYAENRLYMPDCDSLFLFHQTSSFQGKGRDNCFVTELGQEIVIDYPEDYTEKSYETARFVVQNMEFLIMGDQDAEFEKHFDFNSWICKFLIDDVFENTDCDFLSSYFYAVYYGENVKYYAGPIWDYDKSIGGNWCNYDSDMFFAYRIWKHKKEYTPYYHSLYDKPLFREKVCEKYEKVFCPLLGDLVYGKGIDDLAEEIAVASFINSKRWFSIVNAPPKNSSIPELVEHLMKRMELLNKVYIEQKPYILVSYESLIKIGYYHYKLIPVGHKLDQSMLVGAEQTPDVVWVEKGTNLPFDFGRELTEDIILDILEK